MSSFHISNYGAFGGGIPCDLDGYCHRTIKGWMSAPVDAMTKMTRDLARELAAEVREKAKEASERLDEWQARN